MAHTYTNSFSKKKGSQSARRDYTEASPDDMEAQAVQFLELQKTQELYL